MRIVVKNLQKRIKINPAKIRQIAHKIACPSKFTNLELRLYFVGNRIIKELNKRFFAKDLLTDVISFNLDKGCAEVFIAPSVVKINAARFKVGLEQELCRCVIHGILHIFGYEDNTQKNKARMWKKQEKILMRRLG